MILLEEMTAHGVLSDSSVVSAKRYMQMNSDWLEFSDTEIKDYLDDYHGVDRGAGNSTASISILMILLMVLGAFL